jgi:hypothetical protein
MNNTRLFENVVAQFIGPSTLLLRGWLNQPKRSGGFMRLPRTFQVLAMTENEVPDESVPDLIRDPKIWGRRLSQNT